MVPVLSSSNIVRVGSESNALGGITLIQIILKIQMFWVIFYLLITALFAAFYTLPNTVVAANLSLVMVQSNPFVFVSKLS
jgi:hypothetical protein